MGLNFGTESTGYLESEETKGFTSTKEVGLNFYFNNGLGIDFNATPLTIVATGYGESDKIRGYKLTRTIFNASGAGDTYKYQFLNATKGTTLKDAQITIPDGSYSIMSFVYTIDKITPGDQVSCRFYDGINGTNPGDATLGCVGYTLETIQEFKNGIE